MRTGPLALMLVASAVMTWPGPARATSDSLVRVLVPVENIQAEGYCQREAIAFDGISNPTSRLAVIGEVLSRPLMVYAHGAPPGEKPEADINPLTSDEPPLKVTIESMAEGAFDDVRVVVEIGAGLAADPAQRSTAAERVELAALMATRNVLALERCDRISVSIRGAPADDPAFQLVSRRLERPLVAGSAVMADIARRLGSRDRCMAGTPLAVPLRRVEAKAQRACRR